MGLKKGMTNNLNGRPKGTPNKTTAQLRVQINEFLSNNWETMQENFDSLEPKEKLNFFEKLLQYGLPKLQATQISSDLERLTDDELDYIINDLKETIQ